MIDHSMEAYLHPFAQGEPDSNLLR
jgi:hypothetical protein